MREMDGERETEREVDGGKKKKSQRERENECLYVCVGRCMISVRYEPVCACPELFLGSGERAQR